MASRPKTAYRCGECGHSTAKWMGRCPSCGSWGSMNEVSAVRAGLSAGAGRRRRAGVSSIVNAPVSGAAGSVAPSAAVTSITQVPPTTAQAHSTGIAELDRVLGSGVVPGSVILMAGEPGVGKSTLLLEVASRWARETLADGKSRIALYITAEESVGQVRLRAERTGAVAEALYLAAESSLDMAIDHISSLNPSLVIVDSVQTLAADGVDGVPGGMAQTRAVTAALTSLAKATGIPIILVGHVTKDGAVAGPRVLEHLVDVVLNFEGDKHSSLRMLRGLKNRFGATDEVGCFEQTSTGIEEISDPSGLFLSHTGSTPPGSAVTVTMDGIRPLLAEVQSLVVDTQFKNPRRAVTGLDSTRVPMILAVLAARAGYVTDSKEVYIASVGGMKVAEPSADLAVALATLSALRDAPLPENTVILGEVGLAGEIRRVPDIDKRLNEAARLGYRSAIIPRGNLRATPPTGMRIHTASTLAEAVAAVHWPAAQANPQ